MNGLGVVITKALADSIRERQEPPLGPLVKFNAEASAAHQRWHDQQAPLRAKKHDIAVRYAALKAEAMAIRAEDEAIDHEHDEAIVRAHPELKDCGYTIDCANDGYQVHLQPDAPKAAPSEPPIHEEWVGDIKRKIESGELDGV